MLMTIISTANRCLQRSFKQWKMQHQSVQFSYYCSQTWKSIHILLSILLLTTVWGCHSSQQISQESDQNEQNEWILFDGRTLDGWEITDFGLQGPVYIKEGSIILERGNGATGITWARTRGTFCLSGST